MAPRGRVLLLTMSLALMAALSEPRAATVLRDGPSPFRAQIDMMRALALTSRGTPVAHPSCAQSLPVQAAQGPSPWRVVWLSATVALLLALGAGTYAWWRRKQHATIDDNDTLSDVASEEEPDSPTGPPFDVQEGPVEPLSEGAGYLQFTQPILGAPSSFPITKSRFSIGRSSGNDLTVKDPSVSRYHAEIRIDRTGGVTLNDLASMNGVYVNNHRVHTAQLTEGDTVEFGDLAFFFTLLPSGSTGDETLTMPSDENDIVFGINFSGKGAA